MKLRTKFLAVYVALAAVPLLAVSALGYLSGARAVETLLREDAARRAAHAARTVEGALEAHEAHLSALAARPALRTQALAERIGHGASADMLEEVRGEVVKFFGRAEGSVESLTYLDSRGRPLFRATSDAARRGGPDSAPHFQTSDVAASYIKYDERALLLEGPRVLRSPVTAEAYGVVVRSTVPVFAGEGGAASRPVGALVAEVRVAELFARAEDSGASASLEERLTVALDGAGRIVYHTNEGLKNQPAADAMPGLASVTRGGADASAAGSAGARAGGWAFYNARNGESWLAAFDRVEPLDLRVVSAANYTRAAESVTRAGRVGVTLALLAALSGVLVAFLIARRASRRIERVAEGARAVASGRLDEQIDLRASGETRELAESFNLMSERLRELVTREAESKQFDSFMRLSAMLTHDLKNAITGLSMLVANMERRGDDEAFRADAVLSLRDATEKLKRLVARLNEPVKSLSGEYRRDARPTDLVAVIRRVVAATAEPSRPLYDIELRLPPQLVAVVEPERIEAVVENLIINALEAMGARGGRLTVEAGELPEEERLFFSVADTGLGMDEDFMRLRLFRPFSTTKTKGLGLGLFTCREIVETHGGRLEVESKPGAGTRFRAVLPFDLFSSRERLRQAQKRTTPAGPEEDGV